MAVIRTYLITGIIFSFVYALNAFSVNNFASTPTLSSLRSSPLCMAKDESSSEDGVFMKSVLNKEIVYDEKSGRFFESKYTEEDCLPDEEYCYLDKTTGENIRLTVEEKERIFMDALQVRCGGSALYHGVKFAVRPSTNVSFFLLFSSNFSVNTSFGRHTTHLAENY